MEILWHVISISMGLVETAILIMFLDVFLIKKNKEKCKKWISSILGFIVFYILICIFPNIFLKYIIATCLTVLLACYLYEGALSKKILIISMYMVSSMVLKIIVATCFIEFSLMDINDMVIRNTGFVLLTVATNTIQFIGINLMRRMKNTKDIPFNLNELLIYVGPFSIIIIVRILIKYQTDNYKPVPQLIAIICVCMGLLFSNVFIWLMFEYIIEQDRQRRRYEEIQVKVKKQYKYYRDIESRQEESRKIWHDINNHLGCIKQLIDSQHPEEATEYLNKINTSINRLRGSVNTGSLILDAILNDKYEVAHINNINIDFEIDKLVLDFMDSIDICTIYGNLLDNAIEACMQVDVGKREINIISKKIKGFVAIKIVNATKEKVIIKNNCIATSKIDKYNHGMGILNISETIKKYDGNITMECENNKFITNILIPVS